LATFLRATKRENSPLRDRIHELDFSNCFKLVEQAKSSAIKEIHMSEDELMSFIDIAKAANIPLSSVYYFNAKGVGPATVKIGRHLRVRRSDYEAWLTTRES
jgi:predicted DNA-binding transcriptional regulator AlpA